LKPFVAIQVNEIQELLPYATWGYIPTHEKPAGYYTFKLMKKLQKK